MGIVLAAGEGKRLRPLTKELPKEMIQFWGKPLLHYILQNLKASGIEDVVIVTSPNKLDLIRDYFGRGEGGLGLNIHYVLQEEPLGPAHAIGMARDYLGTDYFLVHYGDSLAEENIPLALMEEMKKYDGDDIDGLVAIRKVDDPHRYGIAELRGDSVLNIVEKPERPPSDKAVMGVFILRTDPYLRAVEGERFEGGREEFPVQYMLKRGATIRGWPFKGERVDVGKPEDLFRCTLLLQKRLRESGGEAKIEAVVFDADNTLYQTKQIAKDCDLEAMKLLSGYVSKPPESLYDEWKAIVDELRPSSIPAERRRSRSYGLLARRYGKDLSLEMYEAFIGKVLKTIAPSDSIRDILSILRSKKLFVATEEDPRLALAKLDRTGLSAYFSKVITSDDAGVMKPSPKYYELAVNESGVPPSRTLVVGDDFERDLIPALRLGMHVLLVRGKEDLEELSSII